MNKFYFIKNLDYFILEIRKIKPECNIYKLKNKYFYVLNDILPFLDPELNGDYIFISDETPLQGFDNIEWNELISNLLEQKIIKCCCK